MSTVIAKSLEEAIERLRHDPVHPVEAIVGELRVEVRVKTTRSAADSLRRGWPLGGGGHGGLAAAACGGAAPWGERRAAGPVEHASPSSDQARSSNPSGSCTRARVDERLLLLPGTSTAWAPTGWRWRPDEDPGTLAARRPRE